LLSNVRLYVCTDIWRGKTDCALPMLCGFSFPSRHKHTVLWSKISDIFNVQCMEYQKNRVSVGTNQKGFCDYVQQNKKVKEFWFYRTDLNSVSSSSVRQWSMKINRSFFKYWKTISLPRLDTSILTLKRSPCVIFVLQIFFLSKNSFSLLIITLNCFPNWIRIRREFFI
jgi:hypothetical protein